MIQLIARSILILGISIGLILGLVYAPDYLNYQAWNPTFLTMGGVEVSDPRMLSETSIAIEMYWFVGCEYCAKQRDVLREMFADYADFVTLIYINAWDTQAEIESYIAGLEHVTDPYGKRELWVMASELPQGLSVTPYCIISKYENNAWVELVSWQGFKTGTEINELLGG